MIPDASPAVSKPRRRCRRATRFDPGFRDRRTGGPDVFRAADDRAGPGEFAAGPVAVRADVEAERAARRASRGNGTGS